MEEVEEIAEGIILVPEALEQECRVMLGQHATGPRQPEKGYDHFRRRWLPVLRNAAGRLADLAHGAGGEAQGRQRPEAHDLPLGRLIVADGVAAPDRVGGRVFGPEAFQEANRLKEIKALGLAEQLPAHARTRSPIRGCHRRNSPSRPLTVAINLEKEFTVPYRARNRSSTEANRNRPLPEKLPSSN